MSDDNRETFQQFLEAIKSNQIEKVQSILKANHSPSNLVNQINPQFANTSIFYAVQLQSDSTSFDMLDLLLSHGADLHFKDKLKQTIAFYIAKLGKMKCYQLAKTNGLSFAEPDYIFQTPIFFACVQGQFCMVQQLINDGISHMQQDNAKQTCLFYAAREGHYDICKLLIENGANPYQTDNKKLNALHFATKNNHLQTIQLFQSYQSRQDKQQTSNNSTANNANENRIKAENKSNELKMANRQRRDIVNKSKQVYYLVFNNNEESSHKVNKQEFDEQFTKQFPEVANLLSSASLEKGVTKDQMQQQMQNNWRAAVKDVMERLVKCQHIELFMRPVDPVKDGCPDYFNFITRPMDLGTILKRINKNLYENVRSFTADVRLVFNNSITYNKISHPIGAIAQILLRQFETMSLNHLDKYKL